MQDKTLFIAGLFVNMLLAGHNKIGMKNTFLIRYKSLLFFEKNFQKKNLETQKISKNLKKLEIFWVSYFFGKIFQKIIMIYILFERYFSYLFYLILLFAIGLKIQKL